MVIEGKHKKMKAVKCEKRKRERKLERKDSDVVKERKKEEKEKSKKSIEIRSIYVNRSKKINRNRRELLNSLLMFLCLMAYEHSWIM